ncbi:MAG: thioredoxin family protein [Tenacibaculum sp.]|nr:thioredoxin family protein [Tenacibaculum sp.]
MRQALMFLIGAFIICTNSYGQNDLVESPIDSMWNLTYKEALDLSKKQKKPILLYFKGSDWCGPCKKLDEELFNTEKFKKLSKKYFVLYEADIPINQDLLSPKRLEKNKKLAKKFKVSSYPTLFVINHRQKVLGVKKGLILTEYYYPFFQKFIK